MRTECLVFLGVGDPEEVEEGEEVDADDGRAKQRSVFAWQAVNLVNGPPVTRDGGPAAPTLLLLLHHNPTLQHYSPKFTLNYHFLLHLPSPSFIMMEIQRPAFPIFTGIHREPQVVVIRFCGMIANLSACH